MHQSYLCKENNTRIRGHGGSYSPLSQVKQKQPSVEPTQQHDHVDQVHPVHGQRLQGVEEGEAADGGPVQVLVVQVTEAPLLGDVYGHQHP